MKKSVMPHESIELVRSSCRKMLPVSEQVAQAFYSRLFERYPEVRPLFKGDMAEQGDKLMSLINIAVNGLDLLDSLAPPLQELGARHMAYGVKDEDYAKVIEALLWAISHQLQADFTSEVERAWRDTLNTLTSIMLEGAASQRATGNT